MKTCDLIQLTQNGTAHPTSGPVLNFNLAQFVEFICIRTWLESYTWHFVLQMEDNYTAQLLQSLAIILGPQKLHAN
jgi:hypothetical protein